MTPRILVVLASYNGLAYLPEQLESILGQRGVQVHLLVSDDGSRDGTIQWLEKRVTPKDCCVSINTIELMPRVDEHMAPAGNFFRLLSSAPLDGFDAVALADQDDIWNPDKLISQLTALRQNANRAGVSSNVLAFWPTGRTRLIRKNQPQRLYDHFFEAPGPGCSMLLSKAFVAQLQTLWQNIPTARAAFYGKAHHDWLIYALARSLGWSWHIEAQSTLLYRQHSMNVRGANASWATRFNRLRDIGSGGFRQRVIELMRLCREAQRFCSLDTTETDRFMMLLQQPGVSGRLARFRQAREFRRKRSDAHALAFLFLLGVW